MRIVLPFLLFVIILLSSCEKDINLNLQNTPPVLVVNGWVTSQPIAKLAAQQGNLGYLLQPSTAKPLTYGSGYVVKLNTTASYYASDSTPPLSGAVVLISGSDNPSVKDTLKETPKGSGIYLGNAGLAGKGGVTYSLTIQYNGQVYTAQDVLDSIPPIDSAHVAANTGKRKGYRLTYYTHNISGIHYYLFNYYRNDTLLNGQNDIEDGSTQYFTNPNDPELSTTAPYLYQAGDSSYFELFSVSETMYTYYNQLSQQLSTTGSLGWIAVMFTTVPANVHGNISNGAQGFFQASMYWTNIKVVEP